MILECYILPNDFNISLHYRLVLKYEITLGHKVLTVIMYKMFKQVLNICFN